MYFQANRVVTACLHNKKLWVYSHRRESYFKREGKERQHSDLLVHKAVIPVFFFLQTFSFRRLMNFVTWEKHPLGYIRKSLRCDMCTKTKFFKFKSCIYSVQNAFYINLYQYCTQMHCYDSQLCNFPLVPNHMCKFLEHLPHDCVSQTTVKSHLRTACQGKMNQTGTPRSVWYFKASTLHARVANEGLQSSQIGWNDWRYQHTAPRVMTKG